MQATVDHIAVFVRNLEATREFYETYFGAKANQQYHNPRTGLRTYFLTFHDGSRIEIMSRPDAGGTVSDAQLGWNHVALSLGSKQAVDLMAQRLDDDGFTVSPPRTTGDGYYEAVVLDTEGNQIEITV